ncbi:hypothetical protein K1719_029291 [Acacia pycnantha]|nr:hypothetical protein K1719_029291 [Acacia pycnantha]
MDLSKLHLLFVSCPLALLISQSRRQRNILDMCLSAASTWNGSGGGLVVVVVNRWYSSFQLSSAKVLHFRATYNSIGLLHSLTSKVSGEEIGNEGADSKRERESCVWEHSERVSVICGALYECTQLYVIVVPPFQISHPYWTSQVSSLYSSLCPSISFSALSNIALLCFTFDSFIFLLSFCLFPCFFTSSSSAMFIRLISLQVLWLLMEGQS